MSTFILLPINFKYYLFIFSIFNSIKNEKSEKKDTKNSKKKDDRIEVLEWKMIKYIILWFWLTETMNKILLALTTIDQRERLTNEEGTKKKTTTTTKKWLLPQRRQFRHCDIVWYY
jgi:hypothetical protein